MTLDQGVLDLKVSDTLLNDVDNSITDINDTLADLQDQINKMGGGMIKATQQPATAGDFAVYGKGGTYRAPVPSKHHPVSVKLDVPAGKVFCFDHLSAFAAGPNTGGAGTLTIDIDQIYIDGLRIYPIQQGMLEFDSIEGQEPDHYWPGNDRSSVIKVEQSIELKGISKKKRHRIRPSGWVFHRGVIDANTEHQGHGHGRGEQRRRPMGVATRGTDRGINFRMSNGKIQSAGGVDLVGPSVGDEIGHITGTRNWDTQSRWIAMGRNGIYLLDGGTWTDISGGISISNLDESLWSSCQIGRVTFMNHPDLYPVYWVDESGVVNNCAPLPWHVTEETWEQAGMSCRVIASHKNFLFALGMQEGQEEYRDKVWWSHPAESPMAYPLAGAQRHSRQTL